MAMYHGLECERWIVIADSPFMPAHGGGEVEHLGFVRACVRGGLLTALVVPSDEDPSSVGRRDDIEGIRELVHPAHLFLTPRRRDAFAVVRGRYPYSVASRPVPGGLARDVRATVKDATGIVCFSYKSHLIAEHLASALGLPVVMRMHNLEGRYLRALASARSGPRKWAMLAEAQRLELDERRLERAPWVRGIADISRFDARERQARTGTPVAYVPTFALDAHSSGGEAATWRRQDPSVVFLGALDVSTNRQALEWFCASVWPVVLREVPSAVLRVVGRRPSSEVRSLVAGTCRAELHADVAEPRDFLETAGVAVNPAVSGSGVNIKVADYLGVGIPTVSTALGAQGLGLEDGKEILIRDTPAGFAAAVTMVLSNPEVADGLSRSGAAMAVALRDTQASLRGIANLMHSGSE